MCYVECQGLSCVGVYVYLRCDVCDVFGVLICVWDVMGVGVFGVWMYVDVFGVWMYGVLMYGLLMYGLSVCVVCHSRLVVVVYVCVYDLLFECSIRHTHPSTLTHIHTHTCAHRHNACMHMKTRHHL